MHSSYCMCIFFIVFSVLLHVIISPNSVGSNTSASRQAFQVFPTSENTTLLHTNDNQIIGFALMENGFALGDSGTILPFNGCLPVETKMHLNGGTLILQRNMTIDNMSTFTSLGSIVGNNHSCFFTRFLNQIGQSGSSIGYFGNLSISFESDVTLDTTLSFSGTCSIDGKNQNLILGSRGALVVQSGATLTLKNMAIRNGSGTNISCADNTSTLVLQNVTLSANAAMQFPQGKLQFNGDNVFQGSTMFAYVSTQTMLINSNSSLILDTGFTFSCAPTSGSANVLALADSTSQLFLNQASLVTMANGLNLKNGFVCIDGASSFISAQPTINGVSLGNGNASNDCTLFIAHGAQLSIISNTLTYNNVNPSSLTMQNGSILFIAAGSTLQLYQSANVGSGIALFGSGSYLKKYGSSRLLGSVVVQGPITQINF